VLWRDNNRVVVFPPMGSFPVMEFKAKTDFLAWVGSGILAHLHCSLFMRSVSRDGATVLMPLAGNCVVFLGDYKNVQFMNDLFGFTLQTSCVLPFAFRLPRVIHPPPPTRQLSRPFIASHSPFLRRYKEGPYYKNDRNTPGTPFVSGPSQLPESGPVGTLCVQAPPPSCSFLLPQLASQLHVNHERAPLG
jgi:hypothetical protein